MTAYQSPKFLFVATPCIGGMVTTGSHDFVGQPGLRFGSGEAPALKLAVGA